MAFFLADADKSGAVDEEEFVKLYTLVQAGEVHGLGGGAGKEGGWSKLSGVAQVAQRRKLRASIAALLPLPEVPVPAAEAARLLAARGTKAAGNALFVVLLKRGKTVSLVAEYRRRVPFAPDGPGGGAGARLIEGLPEPASLSRAFRVGGAAAAAVCMDPLHGGCSARDVQAVVEEQAQARGDADGHDQAPGLPPLPVVWRGPVTTELQLAQASAAGCSAVVLSWRLVGAARAPDLMTAAPAYGLEVIAEVLDQQEASALASLCEKLPAQAKVKLVLVGEGLSVEAACELLPKLPPGTVKIAPVPVFYDARSGDVDQAKLTEASEKLQKAGFNAFWASEVVCANGAKDIYPVIRAMKVSNRATSV
jgi:indole-3-glycerol phosphate synthase